LERERAHHGSGRDAGRGSEVVDQLLEKREALPGFGILREGDDNLCGKDSRSAKALLGAEEPSKTAAEQRSESEQDDAQRDLRGHERVAPASTADTAGKGAAAGTQRLLGIAVGQAPGGREAEEQARGQGDSEREKQDAGIDLDLGKPGKVGGRVLDEKREAVVRDGDAEQSAGDGDEQRLDERGAEQLRAARAERLTHGRLLPAALGLGEEEIHEVDAGDQQD
jgi:hypothetical protein